MNIARYSACFFCRSSSNAGRRNQRQRAEAGFVFSLSSVNSVSRPSTLPSVTLWLMDSVPRAKSTALQRSAFLRCAADVTGQLDDRGHGVLLRGLKQRGRSLNIWNRSPPDTCFFGRSTLSAARFSPISILHRVLQRLAHHRMVVDDRVGVAGRP